jgi:hypothetical protein
LATSLAAGLLFLSAGRASISTSNEAIAALLVALYPVWPNSPTDQRCHLQVRQHIMRSGGVLCVVCYWLVRIQGISRLGAAAASSYQTAVLVVALNHVWPNSPTDQCCHLQVRQSYHSSDCALCAVCVIGLHGMCQKHHQAGESSIAI